LWVSRSLPQPIGKRRWPIGPWRAQGCGIQRIGKRDLVGIGGKRTRGPGLSLHTLQPLWSVRTQRMAAQRKRDFRHAQMDRGRCHGHSLFLRLGGAHELPQAQVGVAQIILQRHPRCRKGCGHRGPVGGCQRRGLVKRAQLGHRAHPQIAGVPGLHRLGLGPQGACKQQRHLGTRRQPFQRRNRPVERRQTGGRVQPQPHAQIATRPRQR
jgi:hypothetical protein